MNNNLKEIDVKNNTMIKGKEDIVWFFRMGYEYFRICVGGEVEKALVLDEDVWGIIEGSKW